MHIHVGLAQGAIIFAIVLVYGFFWRVIAGWLSQTPVGQAMAILY